MSDDEHQRICGPILFGDFNGDGTTDVLAPGYWRVSDKGTGAYVPLAQGEPVSASSIKVGDFNGDGADDLLRFDGTGLSVLYGRKGDGLSGNWVSFGCSELAASE
ncbi:MAG: VCBS repeat-containing protein [Planctomycetota bacterium]|nr:VCBS repeat-containing protein [Planctomycetota bacterium]